MNGSRMIRVLKRDGSAELFDSSKLTAALWRVLGPCGEGFDRARSLSDAVLFYISRRHHRCVSSAAIFEMCMKVLHHVKLDAPAQRLLMHRSLRRSLRREIHVHHEEGKVTLWDKGWLSGLAQRSWHISPATARILAGAVETELLQSGHTEVPRADVIEMLNEQVASFGLADAVPVE